MTLDLDMGIDLINKAIDETRDERLFRQWCAQLPVMAMSGEAISFEDYRDRLTGGNIDMRPTDELLAELDKVERELLGKET